MVEADPDVAGGKISSFPWHFPWSSLRLVVERRSEVPSDSRVVLDFSELAVRFSLLGFSLRFVVSARAYYLQGLRYCHRLSLQEIVENEFYFGLRPRLPLRFELTHCNFVVIGACCGFVIVGQERDKLPGHGNNDYFDRFFGRPFDRWVHQIRKRLNSFVVVLDLRARNDLVRVNAFVGRVIEYDF